jgi:hypothetical protein
VDPSAFADSVGRVNGNLRAVVRIKTMAREAAGVDVTAVEIGDEMVKAYERIRQEAKALADRAGWNDDGSFDREVPPLVAEHVSARHQETAPYGGTEQYQVFVSGRRAKVLLGLLAAWAEGNQETFEIEARLKANAEAKRAAEAEKAKAAVKPPMGFTRPTD